jgi:hypothetical protein
LQSTSSGFGFVSGDNVFRVVDSPHPVKVQAMIKACWEGKVDVALEGLNELWYVGTHMIRDESSSSNKVYQQDPRLLLSRYHQHHVPSHQDHPHTVRTLQVGVHPRNRIYTYAHFGRCAVTAPT